MDAMIKDKTKSKTMSSKTLGKYFLKTVKIDEVPCSGFSHSRNRADRLPHCRTKDPPCKKAPPDFAEELCAS